MTTAPKAWDESQVEHKYAQAGPGGVRLHYVEAGRGPLVVLLHGFPEFWYCWRHQIPALAAAGYRVVAPDMRGYNLSDKPRGLANYRMNALAGDVDALIHACGEKRALAVVGHDWGGAVAYHAAMRHPQAMEKLVILNAPHPRRFLRALRTLRQLRRSWYMFSFQLPALPERAIARNDFALIRRLFRKQPVRPMAYTDADIDRMVEALKQPGALTASLDYYRAAFRRPPFRIGRPGAGFTPIECPTLVIWGDRDAALEKELAAPDPKWVPNARVERLDASHWVMADAPERVNQLLIEFLGGAPAKAA
jgi:pimeloyl-ACP methyl ester carboxylesterase